MELSPKRNRKEDQDSHFLPEDLIVAEILPRLHIKPLFQFKCVSKRFKSIISSPRFAREYLQRARSSPCPSSGIVSTLLYPITNLDRTLFSENVKDLSDTVDFIPRYDDDDDVLSTSVSSVSLPNNQMHEISGSSNGLILSISRLVLYVSNPLTKQCVALPEAMPENKSTYLYSGIVANGVLSTYKVVRIRKDICKVEIFSSDTGSWVSWEPKHWPNAIFESERIKEVASYKGALYWLDPRLRTTVIYDPYRNPDVFLHVELPRQSWSSGCLIYSGDEETLKFLKIEGVVGRDGVDDRATIWRLAGEKREWFIEDEFLVAGWFPHLAYLWRLFLGDSSRRDVFCRAKLLINMVVVINPRGASNSLHVFKSKQPTGLHEDQLVHVELSPWSSPLYFRPGEIEE